MITVLLCWLVLSLICTLALMVVAARPLAESYDEILSDYASKNELPSGVPKRPNRPVVEPTGVQT